MNEDKKFLALLQVAVPPDTVLTVSSEIKVLQVLGVVSNHELLQAMDIASTLIPASTQATLHGLIALLTTLVRKHPNTKQEHHDELSKILKDFSAVPDAALTYGTFLPICEALIRHKPHKAHADDHADFK